MINKIKKLFMSKPERDFLTLKEEVRPHFMVLSLHGKLKVEDEVLNPYREIGVVRMLVKQLSTRMFITDDDLLLLVDANNNVIQSLPIRELIGYSTTSSSSHLQAIFNKANNDEVIYKYVVSKYNIIEPLDKTEYSFFKE